MSANNSATRNFRPKVAADDPRYKAMVAQPTMDAIDALPPDIRECVHEFGYISVYLAWKKGMSASAIRGSVAAGTFQFVE